MFGAHDTGVHTVEHLFRVLILCADVYVATDVGCNLVVLRSREDGHCRWGRGDLADVLVGSAAPQCRRADMVYLLVALNAPSATRGAGTAGGFILVGVLVVVMEEVQMRQTLDDELTGGLV